MVDEGSSKSPMEMGAVRTEDIVGVSFSRC